MNTRPLPPRPEYLGAEVLNIRPQEHAGLTALRDDLASDVVKHVPETSDILMTTELTNKNWDTKLFNMLDYHTRTDCGTAHCLAGHLQARGVYYKEFGVASQYSGPLEVLFIPAGVDSNRWDELTAQQAALAIDAFMTGAGEECWGRALEQLPLTTA